MDIDEKLWVFSYGSNSSIQLRARVENPSLEAHPAFVNNWSRIFCMRSHHWCGAVASLAPVPGVQTYGGAVQLTKEELMLLDKYEGAYSKVNVDMTVIRGGVHVAVQGLVYISNNPEWTEPPSEHYLTAIHLNLREQWGDEHVSAISVAGLVDERCGAVEKFFDWRHPGSHALTLPAVCVEVNALRKNPWVMPRTITEITSKLSAVGIESTAHLVEALSSIEGVERLNTNLQAAGHICFLPETIDLFKQVLHV